MSYYMTCLAQNVENIFLEIYGKEVEIYSNGMFMVVEYKSVFCKTEAHLIDEKEELDRVNDELDRLSSLNK